MPRQPILLADICQFLQQFAPPALAESWDNVGLLVGDAAREVQSLLTCLTVTPEVVDEAIEMQAQLIVTHHPLPFRPLKRITADDYVGQMLLRLISHNVAVYSPHTAFDSCAGGINQQWAQALNLTDIRPLVPPDPGAESLLPGSEPLGSGRFGKLADESLSLAQLAERAKLSTGAPLVKVVGPADAPVRTVAVACGAAGSLMPAALKHQVDCLLLGETNFHTCLEAKAHRLGLILVGHYASERFAVEQLAHILAAEFPDLKVGSSQNETDPIRFV